MRSIQRLLAREEPSEKVRLEKTRELEALTGVAVENKQSERERKMAVRYHKVKFFERVKLTRSIEKLERILGASDPPRSTRSSRDSARISRLRAQLRRDKYVSILKREETPEHLERKREKLRQKIKENMVADAALAEANEGGGRRRRRRRRRWGPPPPPPRRTVFFMADDDEEDENDGDDKDTREEQRWKEKRTRKGTSSSSSPPLLLPPPRVRRPLPTPIRTRATLAAEAAPVKDEFLVSESDDEDKTPRGDRLKKERWKTPKESAGGEA